MVSVGNCQTEFVFGLFILFSYHLLDIFDITTSKLTSDLRMDKVQEFSDKVKQFDLVNKEIVETIEHIRLLKTNLIEEMGRRADLKNIY